MITKLFIISVMILIVGFMASGLVFLIRDGSDSKRTVKALTFRISTSILLFVSLFIAFKLGFISPHNL